MTESELVNLACEYSEAYDNGYRTVEGAISVLEEHGKTITQKE